MYKKILMALFVILFSTSSMTYAHSGRTDSSGGHNCSQKSINKGLCSGYHYHNGGSTKSSQVQSIKSNDKNCSDFSSYDEVVEYWNLKGYSATNDPENLDGWGKNVVDDGIPCEPPSNYDLTKVNNSSYQKNAQDEILGEELGFTKGYEDAYSGKEKKLATEGSSAYKKGYETGYLKGYIKGEKTVIEETNKIFEEGYNKGILNEELKIPSIYETSEHFMKAYKNGYSEGNTQFIKLETIRYMKLGEEDSYADSYKLPNIKEVELIEAYKKGYETGLATLELQYKNDGYNAAFELIDYEEPKYNDKRFIDWYKSGFESNEEVTKIVEMAYQQGKNGEKLIIPKEYENATKLMSFHYDKGKEDAESSLPFAAGTIVITGSAAGYYLLKKSKKKLFNEK
jgi:hypothetical protein